MECRADFVSGCLAEKKVKGIIKVFSMMQFFYI